MNNLKKSVAIVLAVAMVLTMGIATSFAAFSDVPSTKGYAEAVNILNNLGIINGYEDGTFKPDNTITRAEVATIMCNTFGLSPVGGTSAFTDVDSSNWAVGYINAAYSKGIISGMGDGTFAPNADVTYEQVVKMIVAGLGYTSSIIEHQGGYPQGYLAVAASEGISSGATGSVGVAATRATVAKLIYNSLEVPNMTSYGYTNTGEISYQPDDTKTILSNLGVEKLEVVVSGSYLTDESYDPKDTMVELVANKRYSADDYPNSNYITDDVSKGDFFEVSEFAEGGTAAASLLGYACVAYVGVDDDTDLDTIFAISAKGSKNTVTTVTSDQFEEDEEPDGGDSKVYYRSNKKTYKLTFADEGEVKVFVNYENNGGSYVTDSEDDYTDTSSYENELGEGGVVEFIDNDSDGDVEYIIISKYTDEAVIEKIEEEDDVWSFETYVGDIEDYDPEDEDVLKLFVKGETYIDVSELAEGDTITTIEKDGGDIFIYTVSSDTLEGSVTEYDSDSETYTISGKSGIGISPRSNLSYNDLVNGEGMFYLNADGLISYADLTVSVGGDLGYVVAIEKQTGIASKNYDIVIVDEKGSANTYSFASKLSVYDESGKRTPTLTDKEDMYNLFVDEILPEFSTRLVKFTTSGTSNGNPLVNKVIIAGYDDYELGKLSTKKAYDAEDLTIGGATFTNSTVVFNVDSDDIDDSDNVSVGTVSGFFADGETYGGDNFYYYGDSDAVVAVLAMDLTTAIPEDSKVFIVSSTSVKYIDGDNAITVNGYKGGKSFSFIIYNEDDPTVAETFMIEDGVCELTKGSILQIADISSGDYITDSDDIREIALLEVENSKVVGSPTMVDDRDLYEASNGDRVLQGIACIDVEATRDLSSSSDKVIFSGLCDESGFRPGSSATITLVDLTDGTSSVRLSDVSVSSNKAASALRFSKGQLGLAYIRLYDTSIADLSDIDLQANRGDIYDIVAYKFAADSDIYDESSITLGYAAETSSVDDEETVDSDEIIDDTDDDTDTVEDTEPVDDDTEDEGVEIEWEAL